MSSTMCELPSDAFRLSPCSLRNINLRYVNKFLDSELEIEREALAKFRDWRRTTRIRKRKSMAMVDAMLFFSVMRMPSSRMQSAHFGV